MFFHFLQINSVDLFFRIIHHTLFHTICVKVNLVYVVKKTDGFEGLSLIQGEALEEGSCLTITPKVVMT